MSKKAIYISVNQEKLQEYNISISNLITKVNGENITRPGGRITKPNNEYLIRTVGGQQGELVHLKDVAQVKKSYQDVRSKFRIKGESAVAINIIKQQDANTVTVVNRVKEELSGLRSDFPDLEFTITDDQSDLVKLVIDNLASSLQLGIILTMVLIFLFLSH
ncbi:hypothetical protein JCM15060_10020 [Halanaerobaculum tunisiense]